MYSGKKGEARIFNPKSIWKGGGQDMPCEAKFSEKFLCLHNNSTALIKQISLFDITKSHDKYLKFQLKI